MADPRYTFGSNRRETLRPSSRVADASLSVPLAESMSDPSVGPNAVLVVSRAALCSVLDALDEHRDAITVAGAHAVHERTKELPILPTTTKDGDLALTPSLVGAEPVIDDAMRTAGFRPLGEFEMELDEHKAGIRRRFRDQPGLWGTGLTDGGDPIGEVDLLVPAAISGGGRRGARAMKHHGTQATRHTPGLELAVVDRTLMEIENFKDGSTRETWVAGHAGLICAKAYKIGERLEARNSDGRDRVRPKDAVDVWRLMATSDGVVVRAVFENHMEDEQNVAAIRKGLDYMERLIRASEIHGLAVTGLAGIVDEEQVTSLIDDWAGGFLRSPTRSE